MKKLLIYGAMLSTLYLSSCDHRLKTVNEKDAFADYKTSENYYSTIFKKAIETNDSDDLETLFSDNAFIKNFDLNELKIILDTKDEKMQKIALESVDPSKDSYEILRFLEKEALKKGNEHYLKYLLPRVDFTSSLGEEVKDYFKKFGPDSWETYMICKLGGNESNRDIIFDYGFKYLKTKGMKYNPAEALLQNANMSLSLDEVKEVFSTNDRHLISPMIRGYSYSSNPGMPQEFAEFMSIITDESFDKGLYIDDIMSNPDILQRAPAKFIDKLIKQNTTNLNTLDTYQTILDNLDKRDDRDEMIDVLVQNLSRENDAKTLFEKVGAENLTLKNLNDILETDMLAQYDYRSFDIRKELYKAVNSKTPKQTLVIIADRFNREEKVRFDEKEYKQLESKLSTNLRGLLNRIGD